MSPRTYWPGATFALAMLGVLTAGPTAADPPGFPDPTRFTDVDEARFVRPASHAERWENGYLFFRTADGVSCAIGGSSWCTGDFPGRAHRPGSCDNVQNDGGDATRPFVFGTNDAVCTSSTDPILEPGQKVTNTVFGITCLAGSDKLSACLDTRNQHGFVLEPSGSWVF